MRHHPRDRDGGVLTMATYGRAHDAVPVADGAGGLDEEEKHDDAAVPGDRRMVKRPAAQGRAGSGDRGWTRLRARTEYESVEGRHLGRVVTPTALGSASEEHMAGR